MSGIKPLKLKGEKPTLRMNLYVNLLKVPLKMQIVEFSLDSQN